MDTPDQQKPDLTRYVEELRSREEYPEGDAWVSLTDAARITRTSEAMARRWVSSGRIPVKKEAVGIPMRTRLVRVSDVAAVRPIVDPTAAITDEIRKLDLVSIPRQQQQIMEDHQRLLQEAAALQGVVQQFSAELRDRLRRELDELERRVNSRQDRLSGALEQQLQEVSGSLKAHLSELADQLTHQDQDQQRRLQEASARFQEAGESLERVLREQQGRIDTLSHGQDALLEMHTDATKAIRQELEKEAQARKQLQYDLVALEQRQQDALKGQFHSLQQLLEQQASQFQTQLETLEGQFHDFEQRANQFQTQLETLERDQARDVAMFTMRFEGIATTFEQMNAAISSVKATTQSNQQRAIDQEERIATLQREFEKEREARRISTQQQRQKGAKGRRSETTG